MSTKRETKYSPYFIDLDPKTMSNRNLRNHFCEPWFGCDNCDNKCAFGKEYLRRVAAEEIVPLKLYEYANS